MPSLELLKDAALLGTLAELFQHDTMLCLGACKKQNEGVLEGRLAFVEGSFDEFQYWYRSLVRSFSAQVEGVCYQMRAVAAGAHDRGEVQVSAEVREALLEEKRYNPFLKNVELAFEYFPKSFAAEYELPKGDARWNDFRRFVRVRNAITHPKSQHDFVISAEELPGLERAMLWFTEALQAAMAATRTYVSREQLERSREEAFARLPRKTQDVWTGLRGLRAKLTEAWEAGPDSVDREKLEAEVKETLSGMVERIKRPE